MNLLTEEYMTPKKASETIGVHFQTLRNWEKEGKIEAIRTPGKKRYYNVKKFLKQYRNEESSQNCRSSKYDQGLTKNLRICERNSGENYCKSENTY